MKRQQIIETENWIVFVSQKLDELQEQTDSISREDRDFAATLRLNTLELMRNCQDTADKLQKKFNL